MIMLVNNVFPSPQMRNFLLVLAYVKCRSILGPYYYYCMQVNVPVFQNQFL